MKWQLPRETKILSFLRAWYLVGIIGFAIPFSHDLFRFLTPFSLILLAALFLIYHENPSRKFWIVILIIFLAGYGIEVAGVMTGKIFGVYTYGKTLGVQLAGVPLIIGINWVIMVYGALALAALAGLGRIATSILAAMIMTASDFFIEKFAIMSDMWSWQMKDPPLQNYISWFIISLLFSLLAYPVIAGKTRKVAIHGYLYQFTFFIINIAIFRLFWQ
jgi:bisanhydrobacterioruberin hydratase